MRDDAGGDGFVRQWVRQAHHGDVRDVRMSPEYAFDVGGVDVPATAQDYVLGPVEDPHVAALVDAGQVAGAQPVPIEGSRSGGLVGEVSVGDHRPAYLELTGLIGSGAEPTVLADDAYLCGRYRPADGAAVRGELIVEQGGDGSAGLGHPVDVEQS